VAAYKFAQADLLLSHGQSPLRPRNGHIQPRFSKTSRNSL
jgi:hypothetical protein